MNIKTHIEFKKEQRNLSAPLCTRNWRTFSAFILLTGSVVLTKRRTHNDSLLPVLYGRHLGRLRCCSVFDIVLHSVALYL